MEARKVSNKKNALSPKLRFKGFEGVWSSKKLGEIILRLDSGVSVNSIDEPIFEINEYGILKTSCISSGNFFPNQNKRIIDSDIERAKLNPVKGSILISRMNTPQLVGHSGYIESNYPNLFVPDRLWMTSIDENTTNSKLLSMLLSSDKIMGTISNIATGTSGSMKNISKPNFLNLEINIPTLPEQQKIASFLSAVAERIQQLIRKKELLEKYKKGVMQQLFSGKLRFKDENGKMFPEWEEKRLGEVEDLEQGDGDWILSENITKAEKYSIIQLGNIGLGEFIDKEMKTLSETDFKKIKGTLIKPGDLLINRMVDDDKLNVCLFRYEGNFVTSVDVCWIRSAEGINNKFFMYLLITRENQKKLLSLSSGSGRVRISKKNFFDKFLFLLPNIEEQKKIATYLSAIDSKIESVNRQITQTQTFKKGLLQQMFV